MTRLYQLVTTLGLALVLTACLGPQDVPNESTYTIKSLKPSVNHRSARTSMTLLVSEPVAAPGYDSSKMRYMITPYKLQSFSKNKWVAPPANMLLPVFVQSLLKSGYFKAVVTSPFSGLTDYNLQTDVLEFEQNFMRPQSRFVVTVQADLVNSHTNKIQASRRFSSIVPAQQNDPYGGVMAANQAVAQVSSQIAQFVRRSAK